MNIQDILKFFDQSEQVKEISSGLSLRESHVQLKGSIGSSRAFYFAAVFHRLASRHHLIILPDADEAQYMRDDLSNFIDPSRLLFYPSPYRKHIQLERIDKNNIQQRTEVLERLKKDLKSPHVILTYPEALAEKVFSREQIKENTYTVTGGDQLDLDFMIDFLVDYGFERVDFVYEPGTFSVRGGIIDVFSFAHEKPARIELFDEEVEQIKSFDPETQLSEKRLQYLTIIPNLEQVDKKYERQDFISFLPEYTAVWAESFELMFRALEDLRTKAERLTDDELDEEQLHPLKMMAGKDELLQALKARNTVEENRKSFFDSKPKVQVHNSPQPTFNKKFELLADKLEENKNAGYKTFIFSESTNQQERIRAILEDIGREPDFVPVYKSIHKGFLENDLKIACYTEHEIFNRFKNHSARKSYNQEKAITLKELYQLQPGDFIVHIDHGVGRFSGLEKIDVQGTRQEAVRIEYKGGDLLYVNIHSLHKISRFVGQEGKEPSMHKLGGNAWEKMKQRTKKKVKDIARDLIKLYASRKSKKGFAFSPDSYLQHELEASFIYEDTPDQAKSTAEVKADMEQPHPMDRLVCGDVGFGKTEVAIRAAFKAATDGKQVAVLVPTTVLALQHYKTFSERLEDLPVSVDYLNRFKSTKQIKETLAKVKSGKVEIVIGTHRLLSKDVEFKDLGLLIIDEEQKFGVAAKEKLRSLKVNVDTLTLTATPIPRTLQFSLMGARDLSTINTPPPNRQSIDTRLHVYNEQILAEAVEYEVARGGQVFFVHNRIKDIYHHAENIESLCPNVKVAVAHGQMEGRQLEEIMVAFVDGFYDVLVSTTIIESGLDISNANTMIVNGAQNFGLSDLYQMRGRVGRSNKKAFCYLFTPPIHTLSSVARKRLAAIEQHSDLGSGFNIAMRDLDIRGAGNILGAEQSGFIAEIGVDMYYKILEEAVQELHDEEFEGMFKGDKKIRRECQIDTDLELVLPDHYVSNINERMNLYRELNEIQDEEGISRYRAALEDRFGPVPEPTDNLLDTLRLKWLGESHQIVKMILKKGKMIIHLPESEDEAFYQSETFGQMLQLVQSNPKKIRLKQKEDRVNLVFDGIKSVHQALELLRQLEPATV